MAAWEPTHLVHPEPIDARPQPDPSWAAEATLAAGVEVIVRQVVGDWSEVVGHNGWTGWVDGRGLIPVRDRDDGGATVGADPPPTQGPGLAGAAGAAGVLGAAGVAGLVGLTGPDVATGGPGEGTDVGDALSGTTDLGAAGVSSLGAAVHPTGVAGAGVGGAVDATGAAGSSLGAAVHPTGVAGAGVGGAVQPTEAAGAAVGGAVHLTTAAGVGGAVRSSAAAGSVVGAAVDPAGDTSAAARGAAKARRGIGTIVGVLAALFLVLVPVGAAVLQNVEATGPGGADLTGCQGIATSSNASAGAVGTVSSASGNPSSPSHPFVVDPNGSVSWQGSTDATITDNAWHVKSYGFPIRSGGGANDEQRTTLNGQEDVKDYLKVPVVGLFQVSGDLQGAGGTCSGSMWVKVDGSPLGTPAWIAAVLLLLGGAALVWFSRPSTRKVG